MKPDHAASRSPAPLRGIGIMLCACLFFPAGDAIAKYLTGTHHALMILWFKYVFYLVFGGVPDGWTSAGAAVLVASGLYLVGREKGRRRGIPG